MPTTTNFGWTTPADTDLVKDGALAIRTLGNGIDTSMVDLKGGTTGQILSKASNTDMDFTWIANDQGDITGVTAGTGISGGGTSGTVTITNSMATEITAAGDIIVGTGSGTFDNLPIGTTGQVLTADTTVSPYKVKWAAAGSSGALTLITRSAFSNVATADLNSIFTTTYKTYLVIVENAYTHTASQDIYMKVKYGSTTLSSDYYTANQNWSFSNTNTNKGGGPLNYMTLFDATTSTYRGGATLYFSAVGQTSERFRAWGNYVNQNSLRAGLFGATTDTAQTYDGLVFSAASGNFTGTVAVYGLGV